MKTFLKLSLSILCTSFICAHINAASNEQSLDRIVAIVNDAPITQTELDEAVATMRKQIAATNTPVPTDAILHKQILQQLVDKKLQLQLAAMAGIQVKDEDLDRAITHVAESNNMTMQQLYEQLPKQGMSITDYRKEIHDEMLIQQVQQHEVGSKITITPQELSDFTRSKAWQASNSKEYHLEDIVIALPDTPSTQQVQEAKKHASDLLDKIHHGMSFHSAAMAESGNKAMEGGDLGWRKLPEVPSAFADEIMHMQNNDYAGPVQTPNGFHILHLAGVRDVASATAPSSKQVEQLIFQRKLEEALPSWMAKIRSQAFVNTNPEG
jgi:peptidyl-prolyl cis-trans isomerase SurA